VAQREHLEGVRKEGEQQGQSGCGGQDAGGEMSGGLRDAGERRPSHRPCLRAGLRWRAWDRERTWPGGRRAPKRACSGIVLAIEGTEDRTG
jgi:hypothetical protein